MREVRFVPSPGSTPAAPVSATELFTALRRFGRILRELAIPVPRSGRYAATGNVSSRPSQVLLHEGPGDGRDQAEAYTMTEKVAQSTLSTGAHALPGAALVSAVIDNQQVAPQRARGLGADLVADMNPASASDGSPTGNVSSSGSEERNGPRPPCTRPRVSSSHQWTFETINEQR
jgi:hypothetical protein